MNCLRAGRCGVLPLPHGRPPPGPPPHQQAVPGLRDWGSGHTPEHVWPAVRVVAAHLQADTEDGIHAQDVGCVQPYPLQLPDLLQFLLHF